MKLPLLVPEQLALEQVLRHGRAVLGDEELRAPARAVVHRGGDELLADARLALDEHRDPRVDDLRELLEERAHRRAVADDLLLALPDAPRLFARLEERVLFLEPLVGGAQALHEPRVGDRQRRVVREHGADVEVALS